MEKCVKIRALKLNCENAGFEIDSPADSGVGLGWRVQVGTSGRRRNSGKTAGMNT